MSTSPLTLQLADGTPMAFPASATESDVRTSGQAYANGDHGAERGPVQLLRGGVLVDTLYPAETFAVRRGEHSDGATIGSASDAYSSKRAASAACKLVSGVDHSAVWSNLLQLAPGEGFVARSHMRAYYFERVR